LAGLVCMEPIKHFYYYCDLAGFARCTLLDYSNSKNASGGMVADRQRAGTDRES